MSRLRLRSGAAGRMAMLFGAICAISSRRRRAYSCAVMLTLLLLRMIGCQCPDADTCSMHEGIRGRGAVPWFGHFEEDRQRRDAQVFDQFDEIPLGALVAGIITDIRPGEFGQGAEQRPHILGQLPLGAATGATAEAGKKADAPVRHGLDPV